MRNRADFAGAIPGSSRPWGPLSRIIILLGLVSPITTPLVIWWGYSNLLPDDANRLTGAVFVLSSLAFVCSAIWARSVRAARR